jgi:hypothetical protein
MKQMVISLLGMTIVVSLAGLLFYSFLFYKYYKVASDEKNINAYYQSRIIRSSYISGLGNTPVFNTYGDSINKAFEPFVRVEMPSGMNYGSMFDNKNEFHRPESGEFTINELALMYNLNLLKKFNLSSCTKSLSVPNELVAWTNSVGERDGVTPSIVKNRSLIMVIAGVINLLITIWLFIRVRASSETDLYEEDYIYLRSNFVDGSWLWIRKIVSIFLNLSLFIACSVTIFAPFFLYFYLFDHYYSDSPNYFFELNFSMILLAILLLIFHVLTDSFWWIIGKK